MQPAAGAHGATIVYFSPQQPPRVPRGNWIQAVPGKGWFTITKAWRPGEIERVR